MNLPKDTADWHEGHLKRATNAAWRSFDAYEKASNKDVADGHYRNYLRYVEYANDIERVLGLKISQFI